MGQTDRPRFVLDLGRPPTGLTLPLPVVRGGGHRCLLTIGIALVSTQADIDPVGAGYDAANRALTMALVLLVAFAWLLRSSPPRRPAVRSVRDPLAAIEFIAPATPAGQLVLVQPLIGPARELVQGHP